MPWWAGVLALVLGLLTLAVLVILLLFWIASRKTPTRVFPGTLDGHPVQWRIHERHWIALGLKGWGQGVGMHVYLDFPMVEKTKPRPKRGTFAAAYMVGHELFHSFRCWLRGKVRWLVDYLTDLLRVGHKRHPEEVAARAAAHAIATGTHPRISCPALREFWNVGDPEGET